MVNLVVPKIPETVRDKAFGASDIKWVKTVNDTVTHSAYLPPDEPYIRVVDSNGASLLTHDMARNSNGVFFCLQLNPRYTNSLNSPPIGEGDLILLYQKLLSNNKLVKCFTHLVTPIGDKVIPCPYGGGWPGRWVKVIAMTKNNVVSSINSESIGWSPKFRNGRVYPIDPTQQLSDLQQNIWDRFQCEEFKF